MVAEHWTQLGEKVVANVATVLDDVGLHDREHQIPLCRSRGLRYEAVAHKRDQRRRSCYMGTDNALAIRGGVRPRSLGIKPNAILDIEEQAFDRKLQCLAD